MERCVNFAYGSNLHPVRMGRRCPGARLLGCGVLPGWRLAFRKRGQDGSAKGDAVWTGRPEDGLWVAAYALSAVDKARLDYAEGLGRGYREETVRGVVGGAERGGSLYVAEGAAVDGALRPFEWYRAMVAAGAAYHGFPPAYQTAIRSVPAAPDLDGGRAAREWGLVAALEAANRACRPAPGGRGRGQGPGFS